MEQPTVYRVKPGYSIHLPFHQMLREGELLKNPDPELVRQNLWKLEPVDLPFEDLYPLLAHEPEPRKPEGVSIIIPAWKAADFLQECLDSLVAQGHLAGDAEYEIILGVDGCNSTKKRALKIARNYGNLKIYWFDQNYGPYIVKNTLAAMASHRLLLFFDADDIAEPEMLGALLEMNEAQNRVAIYMKGQDTNGNVKQTCGVFLIRRDIFLKVGGFMPWRCAADTEFLKRLPAAKIIHRCCEQVLMRRRVHDKQLTVKTDTGFGSMLRAGYMRQIKQFQRHGLANIGLVTVEAERMV